MFLQLILLLTIVNPCFPQDENCPPGCFCDKKKGDQPTKNETGLLVHCLPGMDFEIDFSSLPTTTLQLDLNKYGMKSIESYYFSNVRQLEKLDLSSNKISWIADKSFASLQELIHLDLSENMIEQIFADTFTGLRSLQRLRLNENKIKTIQFGAFDPLISVQRIELLGNRFVCDCELSWILDWAEKALKSNVKCSDPPEFADVLLKKLNQKQMVCDVPVSVLPGPGIHPATAGGPRVNNPSTVGGPRANNPSTAGGHRANNPATSGGPRANLGPATFPDGQQTQMGQTVNKNPFNRQLSKIENFVLNPGIPQLVVEGDPFRLSCSLPRVSQEAVLSWFLNRESVTDPEILISKVNPVLEESGGIHSNIYINKIRLDQAGTWTCRALLHSGYREERSVEVQVMSSETVLCPAAVTNTSKGLYSWGVTLAGQPAVQDCVRGENQFSKIRYNCDMTGDWSGMNDTECRHINDVTDKLSRFSAMNQSRFDPVTLEQAAEKLFEYTTDAQIFRDPQDIIYLTKSLENYVYNSKGNPRLAEILVRLITNIMHMDESLLLGAQRSGHAATRLVIAIFNIAKVLPTFQYEDEDLLVYGLAISQKTYAGMSCSWVHSNPETSRSFSCSERNESLGAGGTRTANIIGSVELPPTLYYQLGLLDRDTSWIKNLVFTAFKSDQLFPQTGPISVVSPVLGVSILNMEPFNLSEPVYVVLQTAQTGFDAAVPAWWNPRANKGLGGWSPDHCKLMKMRKDAAVFSCNRLGHYALLRLSDAVGSADYIWEGTPPAVYVGSLVGVLCLSTSVFLYTILFPSIFLSTKLKHSLINLWTSIMFFLVFYGISGDLNLSVYCCVNSLFVHYCVLSTVVWLALSSVLIHRKLLTPIDRRLETENIYGDLSHQDGARRVVSTPVTGYYMIGWGVPFIICGITAGANYNQFSGPGSCFISVEISAASVLAPSIIVLAIHTYYTVSILCRSNRFETRVLMGEDKSSSRSSLGSRDTLLVCDKERGHRVHGGVLSVCTVLLLSLFGLAAANIYALPSFKKEVGSLLPLLYSVLSAAIGLIVLSFYCLLRQDIWRTLKGNFRVEDSGEESSNLLSPQQLRNPPIGGNCSTPNNLSPNVFRVLGNSGVPQHYADHGVLVDTKPTNQLLNLTGKKYDADTTYNIYSMQDTRGSVIGYIAPNNSVSDVDSKHFSDFFSTSQTKIKNVNINAEKDKLAGKAIWNQNTPERVSFGGMYTPEARFADLSFSEDWNRSNGFQSEISPSLPPPPVFSPVPFIRTSQDYAWREQSPQTASPLEPTQGKPFPASLSNHKRRSRSRDRLGSSRTTQSGVSDLDRTDVASRYSEVSSSIYSSKYKRKSKDKPRRKPRKRSDVLQSGSKRYKKTVPKLEPKSEAENEAEDTWENHKDGHLLVERRSYQVDLHHCQGQEGELDLLNFTEHVVVTSVPDRSEEVSRHVSPNSNIDLTSLTSEGQERAAGGQTSLESSTDNLNLSQSDLMSKETCV